MKRVAINGMGRIGRLVFRGLLGRDGIEIAAVNDIAGMDVIAYLLRHSTEHGAIDERYALQSDGDALVVNGTCIPAFREPDARMLPWKDLGIDLVLDCSGAYTSRDKAQEHIDAGAKRVLVSAAAGADIPTVVYGVNEDIVAEADAIVSGASCSTVGLTPLAKALNEFAPILHGVSTTIHALTSTQMTLDDAQRKGNLRRSRTASTNIIPTTAAAAQAVGNVLPELKGRLSGSAIRVPVTKGSYIQLVATVGRVGFDAAELNEWMRSKSDDLFGYSEEELVSSDIAGTECESIFDPFQTKVADLGNGTSLVECATWFDNETSYVSHFLKLCDIL